MNDEDEENEDPNKGPVKEYSQKSDAKSFSEEHKKDTDLNEKVSNKDRGSTKQSPKLEM